jgi:hypothetical protein
MVHVQDDKETGTKASDKSSRVWDWRRSDGRAEADMDGEWKTDSTSQRGMFLVMVS